MVRRNIIANTLGKGWAILMAITFVPIYIRFLGVEAYGLVGFMATIQAVVSVLDLGLGATLTRELGRGAAIKGEEQRFRDLVRTLEVIYWMVAMLIGLSLASLSAPIAAHWLNAKNMSPSTVQQALMLMGFAIALQWPMGLYSGGLMGLQRQVLQNALTATLATVRALGAVLVLWLVDKSIEAFFLWQVIVSAVAVVILSSALWLSLPKATARPRFRLSELHQVYRFALGMIGISIATLLLSHTDKLVLSGLLPLEQYGYYTLSGMIAAAVPFLVGPVFAAAFPHMSQLVAANDYPALRRQYHQLSQLLSVTIIPAVLVVAFFSYELMLVWTGDSRIAEETRWIVGLLVIGSGLNGLMHVPYALQLAHGWTNLALGFNIVSIVLLVPMIIIGAQYFGGAGAASVWVVLNVGYLLAGIPLMHKRLLREDMRIWYLNDFAKPVLAAVPIVILGRWLFPSGVSGLVTLLWLGGVGLAALAAAVAVAPLIRTEAIAYGRNLVLARISNRTRDSR